MQEHGRHGFNLWVGKSPWRRAWQPTPVILQENPMDRGALWAIVHGVAKSQTWLEQLSRHSVIYYLSIGRQSILSLICVSIMSVICCLVPCVYHLSLPPIIYHLFIICISNLSSTYYPRAHHLSLSSVYQIYHSHSTYHLSYFSIFPWTRLFSFSCCRDLGSFTALFIRRRRVWEKLSGREELKAA